jgi:protein-S-isoprenylcysteine O-methyltransferase Ste14
MNDWLPIVAVVVLGGLRLLEINAKRDTIAGKVQETWTLRLFLGAGLLMTVGGIIEYLRWDRELVWGTFLAGCLCGIGSFVIRRQTIAALGRFWSLHIEMRQNHQLIREGPFRWMRHPTYFSMILELAAIGLILNVRYIWAVALLIFIPTLWVRIRREEAALVEEFGDAYREYQRGTPAVIPYKWF